MRDTIKAKDGYYVVKGTEGGMNMEYRIRKCGHGGFTVEKGIAHKGGEHIPGMLGSTMSAFIVYESAHFDTKRQAQAYIRKH